MDAVMGKTENEFFTWLSRAVSPSVFDNIKKSYTIIDRIMVQKEVLKQPLLITKQVSQIENALKQVRKVFGGKKMRNAATTLLKVYLSYLKEMDHDQLVQMETPDVKVQENWIRFDFTNAQSFERTVPVYCNIGGIVIEGRSWARILVAIVEHEISCDNPAIRMLYDKSLFTNRPDRPFLMREKINGLNCSKLSNGYWINVNQSIPRLMQIIYGFCLHCGYENNQIEIYGIPKDNVNGSKSMVQAVRENTTLAKQVEDIVLKADLNGVSIEELAAELKISVLGAKNIVQKLSNIVNVCNRLIHKDAFIDWDNMVEKLDIVLDKLMSKNNGYVSDIQLYEYARLEMQMLLNDNDMDDQRKVYDLAEHLFSKENYKGRRYAFSNKTHISQAEDALSSKLDIMQKYARDKGGFFYETELEEYLNGLGIKTANLRQQMRIYDEPIFLFYDQGTYITSESIGIDEAWLSKTKVAIDKLFSDVGDHIVLRDIQPWWFAMLPKLPGDRPWTALLLQSIASHYGNEIGARTIYGLATQTKDTLNAMLVSINSEIQTFGDAVITVLLEEQIDQRQFEAEELRRLLVDRGLIAGNELIWNMPKALPRNERFIWDTEGQHVTINI